MKDTENKKILFFLHLPPPVHGSSMVGESIKKSKLVNRSFQCNYINLLASNSVNESGIFTLKKMIGFISIIREVLRILKKNDTDVCYYALTISGFAFFRDLILILIIKLFRVNIIYHLHNKGVVKYQNKIHYNFFYSFVFKNTKVILLSPKLYSDISKYVTFNDIHICPNGVPLVLEVLKTGEKKNKIVKLLFLSNLIESKGVFVLLESLSLLRRSGVPFSCDFVGGEGDIDARQFDRKIIELDLKENVSYKGKLFGSDKNSVFHESDIFVFPTHYPKECFPLVLLEAMQHALPIISTFEGGIPDIVQDGVNGYLVSQKDIKSLSDKIKLLILQPELRLEMGRANFEKYNNHYKLDNFEKRLVEILQVI